MQAKQYRRKSSQTVKSVMLRRPKILITKSGIFWGMPGDYLITSQSGRRWICEGGVFHDLYYSVGDGLPKGE